MASTEGILRHRAALYPLLNVGAMLVCLIGSVVHEEPFGIAVYVCLLFALCSAPILFLQRLNDRYALLGIFMALYFLFFGALDFSVLLFGAEEPPLPRQAFLSSAELAILIGAALALGGYLAGVGFVRPAARERQLSDWPSQAVLLIGGSLWLLGTVALVYLQVFVIPAKNSDSLARGLASLSPFQTFAIMLGHLVQPLGLLMLAYGYAKYRGVFWWVLILAVVAVQVAVGFVTDIKIQAMMGAALVILARTLVDNRVPKGWLAAGVAFVVVAFPVFQAYRMEVTGERGLDRAQALQNIGKVVDIVLSSRDKVTEARPGERAQTFLERSSGKGNLELLFNHVGSDVEFLHGRSLVAIPMAFVPRLLMPDKEDLSVGQLFTKEILKSNDYVYISVSHLGEWYWNFGWLGVLLGMSMSGLVLGFVGAKFDLEQGATLTRVLLLLVTVQSLCMGFGGTIPGSYVVWLRTIAAIGLLHLLFARSSVTAPAGPTARSNAPPSAPRTRGNEVSLPARVPVPRFPNLLT
jgi:hypothetical protein